MEENEDTSPLSIQEAIQQNGTAVAEESTEQQEETTENQETQNEATDDSTNETTSEMQVGDETTETEEESGTEENVTSDSEIIDLNSPEEETQEEATDSNSQNSLNFGEILDGEFESENDIADYLDGLHSKIEELEKGNDPEFANDYVKKMNDYVLNGGDPANFARVQGVDVNSMSPVDKLTTQIAWNNPSLSQAKAREYVLDKYGLSEDENGSDNVQAVMDSNKAAAEIKELQAENLKVDRKGMSEEELIERQAQYQTETEEATHQQNEERMASWEESVDNAAESLVKDGIVIDLGNGKGFKYSFDADDKYVEDLVSKVEEALYLSGTNVQDSPKLAQEMMNLQYQADNFGKIVKAYGNKVANSTNEDWFKEVHNPSVIARGDKAPKATDALPTAGEAMGALLGNR
jgi:hypothetical protein